MRQELASIGLTSPWRALQSLRNFALTVWDPGRGDIKQGVNTLVYEALRNATPERIAQARAEEPALAGLFDAGYDPALDVSQLERLPDGTLGREYARFIRANQIDPLGDLLALRRPTNLLEYRFRRAYKLHDVLHVVLGCDASILGEVRIVSYSLGQATGAGIRAPALALAVLLLHLALRRQHEFQEAVRLAAEWMAKGERAAPYATFRLEDAMERSVEELRVWVTAPLPTPSPLAAGA
jgi:ubiquinone biosynthesis protein Coq4